MYRCLNTEAVGLSVSWRQSLILAGNHGFEGVDLVAGELPSASEIRDGLARYKLRPGGLVLPVRFRDDEATFKEDLAALPSICKTVSEAGCDRLFTWLMPFSDTRTASENYRACAHTCRFRMSARTGVRRCEDVAGRPSIRIHLHVGGDAAAV